MKLSIANIEPVNFNAFVAIMKVRRGVEVGFVVALSENFGKKCGGRAFAIGAGEVDGRWKFVMRVAKFLQDFLGAQKNSFAVNGCVTKG